MEFEYPLEDVGTDEHGFNLAYDPGETMTRKLFALQVHTDEGATDESRRRELPGGRPDQHLHRLLDQAQPAPPGAPLERDQARPPEERSDGNGAIDIALWDFAGKYYDAPIHELLGTYRERILAYASTYHGDDAGGLDSPDAFAEDCLASSTRCGRRTRPR
ncbi:mandelate racemase [Halococcus salifodinae DSM 8989]|uniref:Mandelate racemase n=1 Tax=Halococcus salifodinae DSM 8989 TaxID=1227456 RepID=M0MUN4_9EURY|nr:mandelate racemase [Halococcus salifodinae DSM 8989]